MRPFTIQHSLGFTAASTLAYWITPLNWLGALRAKASSDGNITTYWEKDCSLRCSFMKGGSCDKIIATPGPKGVGVSWRHITVSSAADSIVFHFIVWVMIFREFLWERTICLKTERLSIPPCPIWFVRQSVVLSYLLYSSEINANSRQQWVGKNKVPKGWVQANTFSGCFRPYIFKDPIMI